MSQQRLDAMKRTNEKSSLTPFFCVFFVAAMLVGVGVAWAGVAAYEMGTNNDKDLCPAMLKLVNEDLKQFGYVLYEKHAEFVAIRWEPMDFLGDKFKDRFCDINRLARFDFNNDGLADVVVKSRGCFNQRETDVLYFLDVDDQTLSSFTGFDDIVEHSIGTFPAYDGGLVTGIGGIGGWVIVEPFLYKDTAYLFFTDRGVSGHDDLGKGILIGKYQTPEKLDEVCYFSSNESGQSQGTLEKKGER